MPLKPETQAVMDQAEAMLKDALVLDDDDDAARYLYLAGFGSPLTCGIAISRARGGQGDMIEN